MIRLPATISAAAREIGLSKQAASYAVKLLDIPTTPSDVNGKARLLDEDGFRLLKLAASKLKSAC